MIDRQAIDGRPRARSTMAVTAKFTEQIVVLTTKEMRAELDELAELAEESVSKVIRDALDEGLPRVAKRLKGGSGR